MRPAPLLSFALTACAIAALPGSAARAVTATTAASATATTVNVELVLDASGSMWGRLPNGQPRISAAKDVLTNFVRTLPADPRLHVGLRIYGAATAPSAPDACKDTRLVLPMKGVQRAALQQAVAAAKPRGATPIALSLQQAASDFPRDTSRKLVVLVTDGLESCNGDLAAARKSFDARGIAVDVRIIGIDLAPSAQAAFAGVGTFENARSSLELAAALGRATSTVAPASATKLSVTVTLTSGGRPYTGTAKVRFVGALDARAAVPFGVVSGAYSAQVAPGSYSAVVETPESGAQTFTGLAVSPGAANTFSFDVGKIPPVQLQVSPVPPVAGARLTVTWSSAPGGDRNWISVARTTDPDPTYLDYQNAKGPSGSVELVVPDEEVPHEVRFQYVAPDATTRVVGRSAPFTPKRVAASLTAPATAVGGSSIEIRWTGPNNQGDYITIVKAGAPVGTYTNYAYTSSGNPVKLTMPVAPGAYELRYASESTTPNPTRASRPITVTAAAYALDAPAKVPWGSVVEVRWTGPNNQGDYITVVKAGAPVGTYTEYAYTSAGNPVKLQMPPEVGQYELRYSTEGASPNPTLASRAITVEATGSYSVRAPATAAAGSVVEVRWTGSKDPREYVTVVKVGAPVGSYTNYTYTRDGNPAKLRMPDEPGAYEIRYSTEAKSPNPTLASTKITVKAKGR